MTIRTRFVVVGPWRSGTKFVWQALRDHEAVAIAPQEILPWPFFTAGLGVFTDYHGDFDLRREFVRAAFDVICGRKRRATTRVFGAKTATRDHLEARDVVVGLSHFLEDTRVVLVQRNDLVARFASVHLATATGRWHATTDTAPVGGGPQRLDPVAFGRFAAESRASAAAFELLERTHAVTVVDYERDVLDRRGIDHVFVHLGLEPHGRASQLGKTTAPIETWIENIEELRAIEAATPKPTRTDAAAELEAHTAMLLREENEWFLLGRARFLVRAGRCGDAHEQAMAALRRFRGPVIRVQAQGLRILQRAWRQLADSGRTEAALDELRARYGACAEFLEAEAEHALRIGARDRARALIARARTAAPDHESIQRLDALVRTLD